MSGGATAVASRTMLRSLVIASDFEFLPEGVRVFKGHFDQRMSEENIFAKIDYKRSGHFFEITCTVPDSRTVLMIAYNIYTTLINTERGDDYDDFKSNLIAKIFLGSNETDKKAESATEELIALDYKSIWQCHTQDLSMDKIVPKHVQLAIEIITSTKLVEDLNGQAIQVHAQSQEDCDKAINKLDVLRKYHDLARRHIHHLFLTEEKDHYELCIRSLPEIGKKLVETTLLDPLYANLKFEELTRACTVRCCRFVHIRNAFLIKSGDKLIPAVSEKEKREKSMIFDLWLGYHYPGIGDGNLKHRRGRRFQLPSVEPLETAEQIRNWLTAGIPYDPNEAIEQTKEDIQQAEKFGISSSGNPDEPHFATTTVQETEQSFVNLPALGPLDSVNNNVLALRPAAEVKDDFLGIPANRRSICRSPGMRDPRTGNTLISENNRGLDVSRSLLDSDIQEEEQNNLSNIVIPQPLRAVPSSFAYNTQNDHGLEFFMNPYCSQSILDSDIPESDRRGLKSAGNGEGFCQGVRRTPDTTPPTVREETEVNSRVFHCTMKQGAPRPAAKVGKGKSRASLFPPVSVAFADLNLKNSTKEFVDEMEANAYTILNSLRNYHGEISLECHFGRMLIKPFGPSTMRSLEKAYSVPAENVRDLLLANPKKVGFTKSITNLPADVEFLLNMKIEETDQRIWSDAAEWTVKYEYICCDHEDYAGKCVPGFIIEMDADSFDTKVKTAPLNFGNLNVHCTSRNWDYLISATGSKNLEEDYGDLIQAIKGSTYIAPGSKTVSMSFELSQRYQIHFQSIRIRRHSRYQSYDSKTLLNITEVHDLDFDWEEGENAIMFFVTSSDKPNSVWYEISLESVKAKVAFKDNLNLELGEETEWTAELLLESGVVMKDICVPANYIITKMDGVGFYNDNGTKPLLVEAESLASAKLPREKRPGFTYW